MIKKITTLIAKLKTYSFKTNVMHEAMELFHDDRFEHIVNTNPELLGMLDCVIEVCGNRAYARPGKPEDYVSLCTGLPYLKDLTWESDIVVRLMRWMRQVFVDESLRDYFLKMSASCLKGRNSDKIFPIWTGEGNNSKSMIVKLFEACFGTYCIKFPTSVITGKRTQSSAPMPEMARAKSTRIAIIQEPDDDEVIRGGMLKELTGGDSFFARALHDNGGDVQAMFKLILMCNKIPPIPTGGKAVKNRTRILPFMSTWVTNAPEDEAEQYSRRLFKMDPFFEKQIPNLAKAFMWVMVQYYPRYMNEGLSEPPIIQDHTRQYWQENDIYQLFINDCLVPVYIVENGQTTDRLDPSATLLQTEVYREFKNWFKETFPGTKVPDSPTVKLELIAKLGRQSNKRWHGVRIVQQEGGGLANI
jgi:phage/plasmid-associated DNA primase